MSERLHYAKKWIVEWSDESYFSSQRYDFDNALMELGVEICSKSEDGDRYELLKDDCIEALKKLEDYDEDMICDVDVEELKVFLKDILKNADAKSDFIQILWY